MTEEPDIKKSPQEEFIPAVILLTDNKPVQCKNIVWAGEATADYMPNYTDLRFPYKKSSLLCPNCGQTLTGTPREIKMEEPDDEDDFKKNKGKPKRKPKPWEIYIDDVRHEKEEHATSCPTQNLLQKPNGKIMALVEACQQITWIRAWRERSSRPEDSRNNHEISKALLESGNIPKLIASLPEEFEEAPKKEELF